MKIYSDLDVQKVYRRKMVHLYLELELSLAMMSQTAGLIIDIGE